MAALRRSPQTVLGYCFIFLVALDWVVASYMVQGLEVRDVPPLLITTVCNSMFLLFLFPHWGQIWCAPLFCLDTGLGRLAVVTLKPKKKTKKKMFYCFTSRPLF